MISKKMAARRKNERQTSEVRKCKIILINIVYCVNTG